MLGDFVRAAGEGRLVRVWLVGEGLGRGWRGEQIGSSGSRRGGKCMGAKEREIGTINLR